MADAPQIERGPADQTLVSGRTLGFGQAQALNRIVAMRTQQAPAPSPPSAQATPPGSAAGSIPVTGTAAPEAPFRPAGDEEKFLFSPTARPTESPMRQADVAPPPEGLVGWMDVLGALASQPNAPQQVQQLFSWAAMKLRQGPPL